MARAHRPLPVPVSPIRRIEFACLVIARRTRLSVARMAGESLRIRLVSQSSCRCSDLYRSDWSNSMWKRWLGTSGLSHPLVSHPLVSHPLASHPLAFHSLAFHSLASLSIHSSWPSLGPQWVRAET